MIDICVNHLTLSTLKEDIGHYRNLCQHTNMSLLESVLKYLRSKAEDLINELVKKEGEEHLRKILSSETNFESVIL